MVFSTLPQGVEQARFAASLPMLAGLFPSHLLLPRQAVEPFLDILRIGYPGNRGPRERFSAHQLQMENTVRGLLDQRLVMRDE